jgi:hypothetical protein
MRVAIVGAGLAGLTCARALRDAGCEVVVFDKGRGPGGRTATRRAGALSFDHGAPVVAPGAFGELGRSWRPRAHGGGDPPGALEVADAAMNAPAKALAAGLDVRSGVRVAPLDRAAPELGLRDEDGRALGAFDRVVVTAPAPQAAELLARAAPGLAAAARGVAYDPCWAAMAAWDRPIELDWDVAHNAGILRWAVAEAAKPGREPGERWVLQATGGWSAAHLEDTPGEVARALLAAFGELCGGALRPPSHLAAHRWRYAVPRTHLAGVQPPEGAIAVAGDWCLGRDAAAAVRSGRAAAELLLA